jgi:hypothetical protein
MKRTASPPTHRAGRMLGVFFCVDGVGATTTAPASSGRKFEPSTQTRTASPTPSHPNIKKYSRNFISHPEWRLGGGKLLHESGSESSGSATC